MIRDRGLQKWQGFFMTEHVAELKMLREELEKCEKPLIDEYQRVEFDEQVAYAMEYNMPLRLSTWLGGFITDTVGRVHYFDAIQQQLRVITLMGEQTRVSMADVVDVEIIDD
ncbi:YolD-like family protein [Cytobacillus purgationiresistens]|uniref:YolD-like protein n=1 Tax=Cytobacillus purgationiresistens TaxID=863449 RepID=A0ABU0AHG2_9BACI|nr:YolD-like family protein [Cytobacillus purgationiresistens]MDQ0270700.1 hypothetical protein [Cytobacillus purgationiresistens]